MSVKPPALTGPMPRWAKAATHAQIETSGVARVVSQVKR